MKRLLSIKAAKCKSCAKQNNVQCPQIKKNDIQCEVSQQFRFPLWFLDTLHNHQTWDHANAAPAPPKPTTTKPGGKKAPPKKAAAPKTQEEVKRELEDCADGSDDSSQPMHNFRKRAAPALEGAVQEAEDWQGTEKPAKKTKSSKSKTESRDLMAGSGDEELEIENRNLMAGSDDEEIELDSQTPEPGEYDLE